MLQKTTLKYKSVKTWSFCPVPMVRQDEQASWCAVCLTLTPVGGWKLLFEEKERLIMCLLLLYEIFFRLYLNMHPVHSSKCTSRWDLVSLGGCGSRGQPWFEQSGCDSLSSACTNRQTAADCCLCDHIGWILGSRGLQRRSIKRRASPPRSVWRTGCPRREALKSKDNNNTPQPAPSHTLKRAFLALVACHLHAVLTDGANSR